MNELMSTDKIKITNRSNGVVLYKDPDNHVRREFVPQETKTVPFAEILAVASQPGGRELLYHYFYFEDRRVLEQALNIKPEVEYNLTEEQLPAWINSCTLEEFQDALDFAPEGIIDLIKTLSISLPLTDTRKMNALKDQLKFDCAAAIRHEQETKEDGEEKDVVRTRRATATTEEQVPVHRSKYNVISKSDN